jgi:hypothetical protein
VARAILALSLANEIPAVSSGCRSANPLDPDKLSGFNYLSHKKSKNEGQIGPKTYSAGKLFFQLENKKFRWKFKSSAGKIKFPLEK